MNTILRLEVEEFLKEDSIEMDKDPALAILYLRSLCTALNGAYFHADQSTHSWDRQLATANKFLGIEEQKKSG